MALSSAVCDLIDDALHSRLTDRTGPSFLPDLRNRTVSSWKELSGPLANSLEDFHAYSPAIVITNVIRPFMIGRREPVWPLFLGQTIQVAVESKVSSRGTHDPEVQQKWKRFSTACAMTTMEPSEGSPFARADEAEFIARSVGDLPTIWTEYVNHAVRTVAKTWTHGLPVFVLLFSEWQFDPRRYDTMRLAMRPFNHPRVLYLEAPEILSEEAKLGSPDRTPPRPHPSEGTRFGREDPI
jgi:hypothetical protein